MKPIGVVADDVTGANDIGIMYAKNGLRAAVFPLDALPYPDRARESYDVLIIDTDSRLDDARLAREKVGRASQWLMTISCTFYVKKTCSVFRGNIGAEFEAMRIAIGADCGMVVLGYPKNGRTTMNGVHYVYGVELAQSQFRNDPIHPMRRSFLPDILREQADVPVAVIDFRTLDAGVDAIHARVAQLRGTNRYLVFDVRNQADLQLLAQALSGERFFVGSSALAEEQPAALGLTGRAPIPTKPERASTGVLVVAGSLTAQTAAQIEYLKAKGAVDCVIDPMRALAGSSAYAQELTDFVIASLAQGHVTLLRTPNTPQAVAQTQSIGRSRGMDDATTGRALSGLLARVANQALARSGGRRIVVAGGDTSAAIRAELGICSMIIGRELEPGVPELLAEDARGEHWWMVLKSGSFGSPSFLWDALS